MTHVHQIDSVTIRAARIRARGREGLDEVEEAFIAVAPSGGWRTARRVVAEVSHPASIGDLFAVVVGQNCEATLGYKALAISHYEMSAGSLFTQD